MDLGVFKCSQEQAKGGQPWARGGREARPVHPLENPLKNSKEGSGMIWTFSKDPCFEYMWSLYWRGVGIAERLLKGRHWTVQASNDGIECLHGMETVEEFHICFWGRWTRLTCWLWTLTPQSNAANYIIADSYWVFTVLKYKNILFNLQNSPMK